MAKIWNSDGTFSGKTLIEQSYPGVKDIEKHFDYVRKIIQDKRYLKIDERPVFVIYKPFLHPEMKHFLELWNKMAKETYVADSFFFIAHTTDSKEISTLREMGFDAVNVVRIREHRYNKKVIARLFPKIVLHKYFHFPLIIKYKYISKYFLDTKYDMKDYVIPTLIPNWNHTTRSGKNGVVYHNSSPELFEKHVTQALNVVKTKPKNRQILFLKSWNEWGEGNYMEPDLKFGKGFIKALRRAIDTIM